ncbi:MAG: hypothetical protein M3137_14580 [Actinomycetota bacterium]|nr:hypothetical protein [Actinomycetota bacterium]
MVERIDDRCADRIREEITEAVSAGVRDTPHHEREVQMLVLAATQVGSEHAQGLLRQSVAAARHAGQSWATIGEQLGVTKQAAQQRFASADEAAAGPRQHLLKPVTAFDEMDKLAIAGAYGWNSVSFGWLYHLLEESDQQWEHRRDAFPLPGNRSRLESQGWTHIGTTYPWQYLKRPLGTPPMPGTPPTL